MFHPLWLPHAEVCFLSAVVSKVVTPEQQRHHLRTCQQIRVRPGTCVEEALQVLTLACPQPVSRCNLQPCPLPSPKGLGRNRGVPGLDTDRCPSAGAHGTLTSAPCYPTAPKGGVRPPCPHTSSCAGVWAGPGNKVIGATPSKKSPPAWTPRSPVAGSPWSRHHG